MAKRRHSYDSFHDLRLYFIDAGYSPSEAKRMAKQRLGLKFARRRSVRRKRRNPGMKSPLLLAGLAALVVGGVYWYEKRKKAATLPPLTADELNQYQNVQQSIFNPFGF